MRITNITLKNFRAFQSEQRIPIRPLTLIYGKNASGKSALIDAFRYWQELLKCERRETPSYFRNDQLGYENPYGVGHGKPEFGGDISSEIEFVSSFDENTYLIDNKLRISRADKSDPVTRSPDIEIEVNGLIFTTTTSDVFGPFEEFFEGLYRTGTEYREVAEQDVEDERERVERAKEWFEPMMTIMATEEGKRMLFDISRRWFERLGRIYISGKIGVSHRRIAGAEYHYSGKMANGFFDWIGLYASSVWGFPDTDYQSLDEVFSSVGDAEDRIAYGNLMECCVGFCVYWFLLGIHDPLYNYFNEFHCIPELREIPEKKHVYSRMFLGGSNGIEGVEYDYIHDARYQAGNYLINRKVLKDANSWLQRHQDKGMQFELIAQDVTFPDGSIIGKVFAIKDTQRDLILSFDEVGTGISQFLPVVLWCMEPPELFAIKQPELHLHPGMQSEVGDLLLNCRRASSEPGNVIVETHSEHLLLRVLRRIRETHQGTLENEVDPVTPDDVCVLYVENLGERSIVRHMPISEDGRLIHDWPGGFFEEGLRELLM